MRLSKKLCFFIYCMALASCSYLLLSNFTVVINRSESLPINGALILKDCRPKKAGDIFAFWVKKNKFYDYQDIIFLKQVAGLKGDLIRVDSNNRFFINDVLKGNIKSESLSGESLSSIKGGLIGRGQYFAFTPHKDSFDSRYEEIGLVNEDKIIGTAIFTF